MPGIQHLAPSFVISHSSFVIRHLLPMPLCRDTPGLNHDQGYAWDQAEDFPLKPASSSTPTLPHIQPEPTNRIA